MKKLLLLVCICTTTWNMQSQEIKKMIIKENTVSCMGVAPMDCLQVKYENETNWSNFYSSIEGFDYEPGYRYQIIVKETAIPLDQVPADASSIRYELDSLLSKVKIDAGKQSILDYITKNNWKLIQMNGVNDRDYQQTIRLNFDALTITGNAGCNGYGGSFAFNTKEGIIAFTDLFRTELFCDHIALEDEFLKIISNKVFRFDVADQTLNFYEENKLVLMFGISN